MNFSKPRALAQHDSSEFKTFNLLRGIAEDRRIPLEWRAILMRLVLYRNAKSGRCNPSCKTAAAALGVSRWTIMRAVDDGVKHGWLKKCRRGPKSNSYAFDFATKARETSETSPHEKAEDVASLQHQDVASAPHLEANDVAVVHQRCSTAATQTGEENRSDNSLKELSGEGESDDPAGLGFSSFGAATPGGAAPEETQEESSFSPNKTSLPSEPIGPEKTASERRAGPLAPDKSSAPSEPTLRKEEFAELQRIWSVRPWPDDPDDIVTARRAYAAAAAEVGGDVILAGARATVAAPAYRGEKARFLKPLGKWLSARGWEKPPLQPASSPPRQQRGYRKQPKPDIARMMLAAGEEG